MIEVFVLRPLRRMSMLGWSFMCFFFAFAIIMNVCVYCDKKKHAMNYSLVRYLKEESQYVFASILTWYAGFVFSMTILARTYSDLWYKKFVVFESWKEAAKEIITRSELIVAKQILINVAMLIPAGFLLYFAIRTSIKRAFLYGFIFSAYMEVLQLVFRVGVFEWDDMIHNALGCALGTCGAMMLEKCIAFHLKHLRRKNNHIDKRSDNLYNER